MKSHRLLSIAFALVVTSVGMLSYGATLVTTVNFDSGSRLLVNSNGVTPLTGGTIADGNGAVLQLGYFSTSTAADLFSGTFVPLTGEGSLNTTFANSSIGDQTANGGVDGRFALTLNFTSGNAGTGNSLPAANTFLAIRFYNATTIASSTFFETIADTAWLWKSPSNPPSNVSISLDDSGLKRQSNPGAASPAAGTPISTAIPTAAPEPTSTALVLVGLVSLAARRRRSAKV